jgi:hypothetical protein
MNNEKLFNLVCDISEGYKTGDKKPSKMVIDGKEKEVSFKQKEIVLNKAIQAFIHNHGQKEGETSIQAFSGSSDLPVLTKDVFNVTMETPNYDLAWQKVFRSVQLQKGQLSWEIATVDSGVAFKLIPEGGKVEYKDVAGEKVTVSVDKYGAALAVTWEIIEGRKLYEFVRVMEDARNKLYKLWADVHYGLLATAGTNNQVAWQGVATDRQIDRDIETINKGANDLGSKTKDSGYGDTANARLVMYASPLLRQRLNGALRATHTELANSGTGNGVIVDSNIDPNYTYNSAIPANKALLVLPGNKIQNAVYLRELGLSKREIESLNELKTYWTAFGATVSDTDQVFELAFA